MLQNIIYCQITSGGEVGLGIHDRSRLLLLDIHTLYVCMSICVCTCVRACMCDSVYMSHNHYSCEGCI